MMDGNRRHPRQGRRADKTTTSFSNEKLEVQKLARMPIFEPLPCQLVAHNITQLYRQNFNFMVDFEESCVCGKK